MGIGGIRILGGTLVGLAISTAPAIAETRSIALQGTGSAAVVGCGEGGSPPCTGTEVLAYSGEVDGSPFSAFRHYREPALLSGRLEIPIAAYDEDTGCFSGVLGVFELSSRRGVRPFLAFAQNVTGTYCRTPGGGSFNGAYAVDSSRTQDAHFRDATGSGVMTLQDDLDLTSLDSGVFSRDDNGVIETRH